MKNSNPRIEALPWPQGELAVYRWPEGQAHQPRGVVLLVHGLGEHMGRYSETAHFLQEEGWICIGYDHLGHGRSAGARGTLPSS
ncbi:MAG: alpha/beta hydrolase, partial [Betaproteobacteria bacterium]|nr:alpha/beta hydrolase [Betaproteobacteria bacterium]